MLNKCHFTSSLWALPEGNEVDIYPDSCSFLTYRLLLTTLILNCGGSCIQGLPHWLDLWRKSTGKYKILRSHGKWEKLPKALYKISSVLPPPAWPLGAVLNVTLTYVGERQRLFPAPFVPVPGVWPVCQSASRKAQQATLWSSSYLWGFPLPGLGPPDLQSLPLTELPGLPHWDLAMSPPQLYLDSSPSSTQPSTTWWRCTMATASSPVSSAPCRAPTQVPRARPALGMVVGCGITGQLTGKRPCSMATGGPPQLCVSCTGAVSTTEQSAPDQPYLDGGFKNYSHPKLCLHHPQGV